MPLTNPFQPKTYLNKGVLASIGGSYLVAILYFGPLSKIHVKESGLESEPKDLDKAAFGQEILTWTAQSMAMYYLVNQMNIDDPIKASLIIGGVVGVFFNALPHYMRWKWFEKVSNKSLKAIMIDCGGHVLFTMVQAFCVAKFGPK
eukprot:126628_1